MGKLIYIIGSLSQEDEIKELAKTFVDDTVIYVSRKPEKNFSECVSDCFDNIEKSDTIYVLKKPDDSIGQGVTYEIEYAKRLNKQIEYISSNKKEAPTIKRKFTGFYDCNNKPIYVGDKIKEGYNGLISIVEWNVKRGAYGLKGLGEGYKIEDSNIEWEIIK